jgi:hypothetical protein
MTNDQLKYKKMKYINKNNPTQNLFNNYQAQTYLIPQHPTQDADVLLSLPAL